MIKKAAIYDPYLDTLGGGERYCLTVAEILLQRGWQVDLIWSGSPSIITKAQKYFNLQISSLNLIPDFFNLTPQHLEMVQEGICLPRPRSHSHYSFFQKLYRTLGYDLTFFLSDGSLPFLHSKQNIIHLQVPFRFNPSLPTKIINRLKLLNSTVVCNSQFTQRTIDHTFNTSSQLLYPPVDVTQFSSRSKKQKIILSVGRFDNILNSKRQDVLISALSRMSHQLPSGWKLVLAGGSLANPGENNYLTLLQKQARGLPIDFVIQPNFEQLRQIYATASIYWHAAGFGVDPYLHPENTEHFGITVVEAMASGLVPIVVNNGGLSEIINSQVNGFLFSNETQLIQQTLSLINSPAIMAKLSAQAITDSNRYSKEKFTQNLLTIIGLS